MKNKLFLSFIFFILLSSFVTSYNDTWYDYVISGSLVMPAGWSTVGTIASTVDQDEDTGQRIFGGGVARYYQWSNYTFSLDSAMSYIDYINFTMCLRTDSLFPRTINIYGRNNVSGEETLLSTYDNSANQNTCTDISGCFTQPQDEIVITGNNISALNHAVDLIRFELESKNCSDPTTTGSELGLTELGVFLMGGNPINNTLPTANIIHNSTLLCANETGGSILNFVVNATDFENDTIYYGTTDFNFVRVDTFYEETFIRDGTECDTDYNFFSSSNYVSNFTTIDNIWDWIAWQVNPFDYNNHLIVTEYDDDGNCDGQLRTYDEVTNFLIKPETVYQYDISVAYRIDLPYNNTYTEHLLIDSGSNIIANISYNQTSQGNLSIYIDGTERFNAIHPNNEEVFINYLINKTSSSVNVQVIYQTVISSGLDYTFTEIINNWYGIRFITEDLSGNNYWDLKRITTEGTNFVYAPTFVTTPPTFHTFNNAGTRYLDIYVSDDIHVPASFNVYTIEVLIQDNEYCAEIVDVTDQEEDIDGDYQNKRGLTGVRLLLDQFIWFIQLPYRLAVTFGVLDVVRGGALLFLIFLWFRYYLRHPEPDIEHILILQFILSTFLFFMKLMFLPYFVFIAFAVSIVFGRHVISRGE